MKSATFFITYTMCGPVTIALPDNLDTDNEEEVKKHVLKRIKHEDFPDPDPECTYRCGDAELSENSEIEIREEDEWWGMWNKPVSYEGEK